MNIIKVTSVCILLVIITVLPAQEIPQLLEIPPSPFINGIGGAGTALISKDAFSFYYNPAHLGYMGDYLNFSLHVYPARTSLFSEDKPNYKASSAVLAYQFRNFKNEKILNLGIAYLNGELDAGEIVYRDSSGTELARALNFEFYDIYALGFGFEYLFDYYFGFTYKRISSNRGLNELPDRSLARVQNEFSAVDYGVMIRMPFKRIAPQFFSSAFKESKFKPGGFFTLAYAFKNYGDEIDYGSALSPQPLPRSASLAYSIALGLETTYRNEPFKLLDFAWTAQADDPLVRKKDGGYFYQSFIGDINIGKNLLGLRGDDQVISRKGFTIEILDFLRYNWGSYNGGSIARKNTQGFSIRTKAIFTLLKRKYDRDFLSFIYNRVDIAYNQGTYYLDNNFRTTFRGISITVSGW